MFLAITTVITTGLRLITTGKIHQICDVITFAQGWDRKLKSKHTAKAFHNHFPDLWSSGVKSLAKDLPSECNRRCTHVMLQELTRGPTFGSAKHPRKRFRQSRACAVAMSVVLQLEERVLEEHRRSLKPRSSGQLYTKGGPKNGSARRPCF